MSVLVGSRTLFNVSFLQLLFSRREMVCFGSTFHSAVLRRVGARIMELMGHVRTSAWDANSPKVRLLPTQRYPSQQMLN